MKAKILWFSNHMVAQNISADHDLKRNFGRGWVGELESGLRKFDDLQIAVAFPDNTIKELERTVYANRTYYRIPVPGNKLSRWNMRFFNQLEGKEYIKLYLGIIEDFQPDIIHVYGTENSFGEIIKYVDVPVIIDIQGILSAITKKWFSGISAFDAFRYSSLLNKFKIKTYYHSYRSKVKKGEREAKILNNASFVIGRTEWDRMMAKVLAPDALYMTCNRVIKKAYWNHQWKFPTKDELSLLSVMNEDFYKGLDVIFKTSEVLSRHNIKFIWQIAGITRNSDYVRIVERKFSLNPDKINIEFLGKTASETLAKKLSEVNFYIHASYIENSPNTVNEALTVGTPVIATAVGGIPSMITHRKSGWLFQEGDSIALAGLLSDLIENNEEVIKVAAEGRLIARERHLVDNILKCTLSNYQTVLGKL